MKVIPTKQLTFNSTNIPDDTTPQWDIEAGYPIDTIRQHNNKLYKAYGAILPLCDYYHDDTDPLVGEVTYITATDVEVDSTAVICVLDETIVYDKGTNKYYIFDNASGATNNGDGTHTVNFSTQDPVTPVNFTEVTGYRNTKDIPEVGSLVWEDLGYTNKYKLIDDSLTSQTVVDGNMEMSFITTKIDSIYLFRIIGTSVNITVTQIDTNTEIYNQTTSLISKNSGSTFRGYFFNDFTYVTKMFNETPINFNIRVNITITALSGSDTKCGLVAIGRSADFGATLYGAKVGMLDFSKKETNTNGESYFVEGNYKPTNSLTIDLPSNRTDYIVQQLQELRAKPVIWKGSDYGSTIIFGIYNDWSVVISTPTITRISINLESLI